MSSGIKSQRSSVVLLNGVTFEPNPEVIDDQQQPIEGGVCIEVIDGGTVYLAGLIVFNVNADTWIKASQGSSVRNINPGSIIASSRINDSLFNPFVIETNSNVSIQDPDFFQFQNSTNFTNEELFTQTIIDTTSHLYINEDLKVEILKDDTDIKGSINNVFYSAGQGGGEPFFVFNTTSTSFPSATGGNSLAIGINASSSGSGAFALGVNALGSGAGSISIGGNSRASATGAVSLLGNATAEDSLAVRGSTSNNATNGLAIGISSLCRSLNSICIGTNSEAGSTSPSVNSSIAIGNEAVSSATNSIQLAKGTNDEADTVKYKNSVIANTFGIEAPVRTSANPSPPREGSIYINKTSGSEKICVYVNGSWKCADLV